MAIIKVAVVEFEHLKPSDSKGLHQTDDDAHLQNYLFFGVWLLSGNFLTPINAWESHNRSHCIFLFQIVQKEVWKFLGYFSLHFEMCLTFDLKLGQRFVNRSINQLK